MFACVAGPVSEAMAANQEAVLRQRRRAFSHWVNIASHMDHFGPARIVDVLVVAGWRSAPDSCGLPHIRGDSPLSLAYDAVWLGHREDQIAAT